MREVVPETFSRCLEDHAVYNWNDGIQTDILELVCALCSMLRARLRALGPSQEADEEDLVPMLASLAPAFDACCYFHLKHKLAALPPRVAATPYGAGFAAAAAEVQALAVRCNPKGPGAREQPPRRQAARERAQPRTAATPAPDAPRRRVAGAGGRVRRHGPRQRACPPLAHAHCQLLRPQRLLRRAAGGARP
jgi:hypothetical protein